MQVVANYLLGLSETIAQRCGCKRQVTVDDHSVSVEYFTPSSDSSRVFENHYPFTGLYWRGVANPFKVDATAYEDEEADIEYITTSKFRTFMQQDIIRDALDADTDPWDLHAKIGAAIAMGIMMLSILQVV